MNHSINKILKPTSGEAVLPCDNNNTSPQYAIEYRDHIITIESIGLYKKATILKKGNNSEMRIVCRK